MSGADVARPWPGQPAACTCTQMVVADLGDTLDCPAGWRAIAGVGWVHVLAGPEQAACEHAQTFAASLADTLNCPHPWQEQPDGTWVHGQPAQAAS